MLCAITSTRSGRVVVVAPDLLDQLIELLHGLDVVLAPVVREDVEARFLLARALARVREAIAARIAQLLHDLAVEILAGRALEDAARHEPVVDRLERLGVDAKREFLVVARQELARAAGPELDAIVGAGETRAEQARNEDDGNAIERRSTAPGRSHRRHGRASSSRRGVRRNKGSQATQTGGARVPTPNDGTRGYHCGAGRCRGVRTWRRTSTTGFRTGSSGAC